MDIEPVRFRTSDDLWLEGRFARPDEPAGVAVLCHPYPPAQGSMSSVLIPLVQRALGAAGWASVRFNFRGVGRSEGRFENGIGEERDVLAAIEFVTTRTVARRLAVVGWSFGAMVGLRAAAADRRVTDYVAIAPPVSESSMDYAGPPVERLDGWGARVLAVCGTEDPYCRPKALQGWLDDLRPGARSIVVDGADHAFAGHRDELTSAITAFLR